MLTESDKATTDALTCLFWNVNGCDRLDLIGTLADEKHADIIVLAENGVETDATLDGLRRRLGDTFVKPQASTPRLQLFSRGPALDLREIYGDASGRLSIRLLRHCDLEFLFVAVHLPSKMNMNPVEQALRAQILGDEIRREEDRRGHRRTVLVGDLNMNPFEDGMVGATGLHGMMTRATTIEGSRTFERIDYPFFYNPMWGFFGDRTAGPPGTYHYRSGLISFDWNMFDQVLIRPDVFPWFRDDIEIVTKIGDTRLERTNGRPNEEIGSDHFPILFRLSAIA